MKQLFYNMIVYLVNNKMHMLIFLSFMSCSNFSQKVCSASLLVHSVHIIQAKAVSFGLVGASRAGCVGHFMFVCGYILTFSNLRARGHLIYKKKHFTQANLSGPCSMERKPDIFVQFYWLLISASCIGFSFS